MQMSKSQRRKQRLVQKGVQLAQNKLEPDLTPTAKALMASQVNKQVVSQEQPKTRRRRNRNRRRRQRANQTGGLSGATGIDYVYALQHPELANGCKIPDIIAYPTGTFQLKIGVDLSCGTGGDSVSLQLYPIIGDGAASFPIYTRKGVSAGSLATATTVSWTNRAAITGLYSLYRPVSACVDFFWIGTEANRSGEYYCGNSWLSTIGSPSTTAGVWAGYPEMATLPIDNGIRVVWKPLDNSHLSFVDVNGPAGTSGSPLYPQILFAAQGLPTSSGNVIHCEILVNFEAIPNSSTADLVQTEPSPYDPGALRRAFEWASQAGNSAMAALENAAPYFGKAVEVGGMAYQALPQRQRQRIRRFAGSAIGGLLTHQIAMQQFEIKKEESGKDEEDEEVQTYEDAEKRFASLNVSEIKSPQTSQKVGVSSPSLQRKFGKGV